MTRVCLLGLAAAPDADTISIVPILRTVASATAQDQADSVKGHHRAVVAHCRRGPFLPAPHGLTFETADALDARIRAANKSLCDAMAQLGRKAEWSLALTPVENAPSGGFGLGRSYLRARQAAAAGGLVTRKLMEHWPHGAEASAIEACLVQQGAGATLNVTGLAAVGTPRTAIDLDVTQLLTLAFRSAGLDAAGYALRIIGPWPVYRFAALRERLGVSGEGANRVAA